MIKHLLTLIWNQRNGNVWIFLELLLVTAMLWVMADSLLVDTYTYQQPLGYDITNTYSVEFNKEFDSSSPDSCLLYTSPSPRDISGSRMPSSA